MQPRAKWRRKHDHYDCEMGLFDLVVWSDGSWRVDDGQGDARVYASSPAPVGAFDVVTQMLACEQAYLDLLDKAKRFEAIEPIEDEDDDYSCDSDTDVNRMGAGGIEVTIGRAPINHHLVVEANNNQAKLHWFGAHCWVRGMSLQKLAEKCHDITVEEAKAMYEEWRYHVLDARARGGL